VGTRDAARGRYNGLDESRLCCYGCSYSIIGEPWPGMPSNERPCGFCIRNPLQHLTDSEQHSWYDGSEPISIPMDSYQTMDMRIQTDRWIEIAKREDTEAFERALATEKKLRRT
jgi:hypothetical protein